MLYMLLMLLLINGQQPNLQKIKAIKPRDIGTA